MRIIWLALIFLTTLPLLGQSIDEVVLPEKTDIFVVMRRTVDTKVARQGDRFHAEVEVPVTQHDQIIIPRGSHILGFVDYAKQPGRLKGKSLLRLRFDTVILPNGVTRRVEAALQSAEHQKTDPRTEDGTLQGGGSGQAGQTAGAAGGGAVTGGTIGGLAGRSWKGFGTGAAVGAATGALIGLLRKGDHVVLQRGDSVTIQLDASVRFVAPDQSPSARPVP